MKYYTLIFISIIALMILSGCMGSQKVVTNQQPENSAKNITAEQSKLVYENTKPFLENTQLSIAIIKNGETQFYGIQRSEDSIYSIENHRNVFEIGSCSKVFTSVLLANLVVQNEVALDDPITKHLDNELVTDNEIKLVELANHTSGLPRLPSNYNVFAADIRNPYKDYGEENLEEYLKNHLKPNELQNGKYAYSNLGAGLLGYVLSQKTSMTYEDLLGKYIFSKYGMTNSTTNREKITTKLIEGLGADGKPTSNWDLNVLAGAGAILSTTEDLSKFAIAQFDNNNEELVLTHKPTFTVNENMDIALGWHVLKNQSTTNWRWHNGGTGGYSSSMIIDIEHKNAVIILSNVSAFHKNMGNIDRLCFALMKTLHPKLSM